MLSVPVPAVPVVPAVVGWRDIGTAESVLGGWFAVVMLVSALVSTLFVFGIVFLFLLWLVVVVFWLAELLLLLSLLLLLWL